MNLLTMLKTQEQAVDKFARKGLVEVTDAVKHYPVKSDFVSKLLRKKRESVHALDGVSFSIYPKEIFAVVGESGSGKTTLGLAVLRLIELSSGKIVFGGDDISTLPENKLRKYRTMMQVVFQDPSSSLDNRMRVVDSITEPLIASGVKSKAERWTRAVEVMKDVGLDESQLNYFPRQFSGGQRQRISIARAIIQRPKFIVLDEPTSSLDVSIQSQILLLLQRLQRDYELSYLLITHNMVVAKYLSDRIAVMYLGRIVEIGSNVDITESAMHPYTRILISSVLQPGVYKDLSKLQIKGEIPSAVNLPVGCRFNSRCPYAREICHEKDPELRNIDGMHYVACHFAEEILKRGTTEE